MWIRRSELVISFTPSDLEKLKPTCVRTSSLLFYLVSLQAEVMTADVQMFIDMPNDQSSHHLPITNPRPIRRTTTNNPKLQSFLL